MNAPTSPLHAAGLVVHSQGLGPIGTNCWVLHRPGSTDAVVVDPGAESERLLGWLDELDLTVVGILVTHSHWDHVGALADVAEATGAPVWMSAVEAPAVADLASFAPAAYGPWRSWNVPADHQLTDGDTVDVAGIHFDVLELPGHSPGSLGFLAAGEAGSGDPAHAPLLVIGDLIFAGSVGRTDLPFGDTGQLLDSCARVLATCSDDTVLTPGHGPETTVGRERASNPFIGEAAVAARA